MMYHFCHVLSIRSGSNGQRVGEDNREGQREKGQRVSEEKETWNRIESQEGEECDLLGSDLK